MPPVRDGSDRALWDYLKTVRRRFWLIVLITVISMAAAAAYTFYQPTVYRAEMKIVVGQGEGIFLPEVGAVADQFTQTMSELLESEVVASQVIDQLGLTMTPGQLLERLEVVTKPSTAVLEVFYDDTDRARGQRILETVGDVFTQQVDERLAPDEGVGTGTAVVSATIFDDAHSLAAPVAPTPLRNLAVAGALGLLLGLLAAFAREQLDDTVRNVEDAEAACGQRAITTLPPKFIGYRPLFRGKKRKKQAKARLDPVLIAMAQQRLRSNLMWSWEPRERSTTVAVTSAHPEEGKTTIAANLAVTMAAEGYDVIIVDTDLRRPMVYDYLGTEVGAATVSLDQVASGRASLEQSLVEIPVKPRNAEWDVSTSSTSGRDEAESTRVPGSRGRLRAILAAPGHSQPSEFDLDVTARILKALRTDADYVILDAPPVLVVTDAYPFLAAADHVVAVARNGKSSTSAIAELFRTLERLRPQERRVADLVVTEVETTTTPGYYGYVSGGTAAPVQDLGAVPPPPPARDVTSSPPLEAARPAARPEEAGEPTERTMRQRSV
jgi:receptor protein-tyrosine kinase